MEGRIFSAENHTQAGNAEKSTKPDG